MPRAKAIITDHETRHDAIGRLLAQIDLKGAPFILKAGSEGGNNRVVLVEAEGRKFVVKWYFSGGQGQQNRLDAEWRFLNFAQDIKLQNVPIPLACLFDENVALYDYIDGQKIEASDVDQRAIDQAAKFIAALNALEHREKASELPLAADGFWTIEEHIAHVGKRLERFRYLSVSSRDKDELLDFITVVDDFWLKLKNSIQEQCYAKPSELCAPLPTENRIISPSDFGFHNALKKSDGSFSFIDFEYAGWDDPAKMLSDFFFQPAVHVPEHFMMRFANIALCHFKNKVAILKRMQVLRPLFGIKWCCIILKPFLPEGIKQFDFTTQKTDFEVFKKKRLAQAQVMFQRVQHLSEL